jgi:carbon monoxide dehydrogenase subunit G
VTVSVIVPASAAEVWDDVARLETHTEWMADAASVNFVGEQRSGVGTQMVVETRVGPLRTSDRLEFIRWDPPRRMEVRHNGIVRGAGAFTLSEEAAGTRFTWSENLEFPWFLGGPVAAAMAAPILRRIWKGNLDRYLRRFSDR